jgi:hypothetical protein
MLSAVGEHKTNGRRSGEEKEPNGELEVPGLTIATRFPEAVASSPDGRMLKKVIGILAVPAGRICTVEAEDSTPVAK